MRNKCIAERLTNCVTLPNLYLKNTVSITSFIDGKKHPYTNGYINISSVTIEHD